MDRLREEQRDAQIQKKGQEDNDAKEKEKLEQLACHMDTS
jgi:hypothetical protein